jgi:hypothetical protein
LLAESNDVLYPKETTSGLTSPIDVLKDQNFKQSPKNELLQNLNALKIEVNKQKG